MGDSGGRDRDRSEEKKYISKHVKIHFGGGGVRDVRDKRHNGSVI